MKHEFKRKSLNELNLTSRFLFDIVMEDEKIHQDVLSIIFGREISAIIQNETEKEARLSPLIRSIRMDVFAMDDEQIVYNTEMQDERRNDMAKRSRYYQALFGYIFIGTRNSKLQRIKYVLYYCYHVI